MHEGDDRFTGSRRACQYLRRAAASPALAAHPGSRLVILDYSGSPRYYLRRTWVFDNAQVAVAYMSRPSGVYDHPPTRANEVGLPPPGPQERADAGVRAVPPADLRCGSTGTGRTSTSGCGTRSTTSADRKGWVWGLIAAVL